jgi:c-di-GMP-specific phosphodiesterase
VRVYVDRGRHSGDAGGPRCHRGVTASPSTSGASLFGTGELREQQRITGLIANGESTEAVLDEICRAAEARCPGGVCYLLTVDRSAGVMRFAAGPSASTAIETLCDNQPIGRGGGAAGASVEQREWQVYLDIADAGFSEAYTRTALEAGIRAIWVQPVFSRDGEVIGAASISLPMSRRPSAREHAWMEQLAALTGLTLELDSGRLEFSQWMKHDRVTGLLNQVSFFELVGRRLAAGDDGFAVMTVAFDRLRLYSGEVGHIASTQILRAASRRISDTIADRGTAAHFGSGEFAVIVDLAGDACPLGDNLLGAFSEPVTFALGELVLAPKIGIARAEPGTDARSLISDTEVAMRDAGNGAQGSTAVYSEHLRASVARRVSLGADLGRAIESDELTLFYQPLIDLDDGSWREVEALVRWHHPHRGLLLPGQFIDVAEESGQIVVLGKRVLELAVRQAKCWLTAGIRRRIAVNVSPQQLVDRRFARGLEELLAAAGLDSTAIMLEITETELMKGIDLLMVTLLELRAAGIDLLIDDFGTGHSSLSRLHELPITAVKIDRSFVTRLGSGSQAETVIRAIADIAASHGCRVVAEGVEDYEAAEAVRLAGCGYAQGFYFGRPMPACTLDGSRSVLAV